MRWKWITRSPYFKAVAEISELKKANDVLRMEAGLHKKSRAGFAKNQE